MGDRRTHTIQSAQDSKRTRVVIVCPCFVRIITVPGLDTELDDLTSRFTVAFIL